MKTLLLFFCISLLCMEGAFAQADNDYPLKEWLGDGECVITGKVLNKPAGMKSWNLVITDYLSNEVHEIPVGEDGYFEKALPITDVQDIYLYLGDAVTVFSFPGDTIRISFDHNSRIETLEVKGTTEARNKELELCLGIYRNFRKDFLKISGLSYDRQKSPKEKLELLNDYYGKKIDFIRSFETGNGTFPFLRKFQDDTYYEVARVAANSEILPELRCDYPRMSSYSVISKGNTSDTVRTSVPNWITVLSVPSPSIVIFWIITSVTGIKSPSNGV